MIPDIHISRTIWGDFFLFCLGHVCCMHSLESPQQGDSNACIQYIFYYIEGRNSIPILPLEQALWLALGGSNCPCPEQVVMVQMWFVHILM